MTEIQVVVRLINFFDIHVSKYCHFCNVAPIAFYWKWFLKFTAIRIHEWFGYVVSAPLHDEITFHTSHICYFSGLYGRYWCASSDYLKLRRILHKNHICNFFLLYGSSLYAYLDYLIWWNIFHNNCIWNFFAFHGLSWYDSSGLLI